MEALTTQDFTMTLPFETPHFENDDQYEEWLAKSLNSKKGKMDEVDGINCPICRNKGVIYGWDKETQSRFAADCGCMAARQSLRKLSRSDVCKDWRYKTFDSYTTTDQWQEIMKARILRYVKDDHRGWLYVSGQSGCGKTHLCTAALVDLVKQEALSGEYIRWMDMSEKLDAIRFSSDELKKFKHTLTTCDILYLDDLFKKMRNAPISRREFDNTLSIIDARYKNPKLMTIISGERTMEELGQMDEAFAGRIHERCGKHIVQIKREVGRNYRLKKDELI